MDIWVAMICGSVLWGTLWSAATLVKRMKGGGTR